jgi:hypothetical protein
MLTRPEIKHQAIGDKYSLTAWLPYGLADDNYDNFGLILYWAFVLWFSLRSLRWIILYAASGDSQIYSGSSRPWCHNSFCVGIMHLENSFGLIPYYWYWCNGFQVVLSPAPDQAQPGPWVWSLNPLDSGVFGGAKKALKISFKTFRAKTNPRTSSL